MFFVVCLLAFCLWLKGQTTVAGLQELGIVGLSAFNIVVLCFFRERGTFTVFGLLRAIFLGGQIALIIYWLNSGNAIPPALLNPIGIPVPEQISPLPFSETTLILLALGFTGCLIRLGLDQTPITQGLITTLVGIALASAIDAPHAWETLLMASTLYLGASIIRDSYNMAYRDELTGLPHRRALNEQFLSMGGRYAVAMLDVDHFKKFNDTHGHDIGDQVLQMVASRIGQVGGGGRAFRYGGEEFTVVFPRMPKEEAFYHLDEVRKSIQNYEMVIRKQSREEADDKRHAKKNRERGSFRRASEKVSVTISIGVAEKGPGLGTSDDVLKAADQALYAAKKAGRNQVCMAP